MTPAEAFAVCETIVRRADEDRYLASLLAPAEKRPLLFVLYSFNHELARASEVARDPLAAEIRLQWWRDALEAVREGQSPSHPVTVGLAEILVRDPGWIADLEALIDARAVESSPAPFATLAAMESHARATSARLMQAAARLLAGADAAANTIDEAGIAYGLAGMLRSVAFHASLGRLFAPSDLLATEFLSIADIVSGKNSAKLKRVLDKVQLCAREHFRRATRDAFPRAILPAVLPASLVPAYLSHLTKKADQLYKGTDILRLRKQLILARAALLGTL